MLFVTVAVTVCVIAVAVAVCVVSHLHLVGRGSLVGRVRRTRYLRYAPYGLCAARTGVPGKGYG